MRKVTACFYPQNIRRAARKFLSAQGASPEQWVNTSVRFILEIYLTLRSAMRKVTLRISGAPPESSSPFKARRPNSGRTLPYVLYSEIYLTPNYSIDVITIATIFQIIRIGGRSVKQTHEYFHNIHTYLPTYIRMYVRSDVLGTYVRTYIHTAVHRSKINNTPRCQTILASQQSIVDLPPTNNLVATGTTKKVTTTSKLGSRRSSCIRTAERGICNAFPVQSAPSVSGNRRRCSPADSTCQARASSENGSEYRFVLDLQACQNAPKISHANSASYVKIVFQYLTCRKKKVLTLINESRKTEYCLPSAIAVALPDETSH